MNASSQKLRVAIVGGGLAGATLIHALSKQPHLTVLIFESAAVFSERGAAVGLAVNAENALQEMGITEVIEKAGGVRMNSTRAIIGSGPNAGTVLSDLASGAQAQVIHRAELLKELLAPVPQNAMHTSKKVIQITEDADGGGVTLYFADGTQITADVVIGADGIHGFVRQYVLGEDHAAYAARFAGFWDCRTLVPIQKAREVLGNEYFEEQRQYAWSGERGFIMHDVLDREETVQCVASVMTDSTWRSNEWNRKLDRTALEQTFASWTNSPITKPMIELLLENPDLKAFEQWHHSEKAPTYVRGAVCIMGDAAHAMTPWQGSGAGQAIEDAMILSALLEKITHPSQIHNAFKVYDEVRRPRTQQVVESSYGTGRIICGGEDGVGLDPDALRKALSKRWDFIYGIDMKKHKNEALELFAKLDAGSR